MSAKLATRTRRSRPGGRFVAQERERLASFEATLAKLNPS